MRALLIASVLTVGLVQGALAQTVTTGGGPLETGVPRDNASEEISAAFPAAQAAAIRLGRTLGRRTQVPMLDRSQARNLGWPLLLRPNSKRISDSAVSNYVDLNSAAGLLDWSCGTRTYEGHQGTDYAIGVYSWRTMAANEVSIVATAPGVIVNKQDGQFDRQCSINSNPANYVIVHQEDGLFAWYWHMKTGSVTSRPIGAAVKKGDYLGLVGSSGNSTGPHLHLEFRDDITNVTVDPYAGACGATGTLWQHQHNTNAPRIARLTTHDAQPPSQATWCDDPDPNYATRFAPGQQVWATLHLDDQVSGLIGQIQILRPDRSVFASWNTGSGNYVHSYWWGTFFLPPDAPRGSWTFRATFAGRTQEHTFRVGSNAPKTTVKARVETQARSLTNGTPGTVDVYVTNTGTKTAVGCFVDSDVNLASAVKFELVNASGVPLYPAGQNFNLSVGQTRRVALTFTPESGTTAKEIIVPVRIACLNAIPTPFVANYNGVTLSFQDAATPDIASKIATAGNSGVVEIPGVGNSVERIVTATNKGSAATLYVRPFKSYNALPVTVQICEINPSDACTGAFVPALNRTFATNQTRRFRVRIVANAAIALDEAKRRVLVKFLDGGSNGILRGQSSVAVNTP